MWVSLIQNRKFLERSKNLRCRSLPNPSGVSLRPMLDRSRLTSPTNLVISGHSFQMLLCLISERLHDTNNREQNSATWNKYNKHTMCVYNILGLNIYLRQFRFYLKMLHLLFSTVSQPLKLYNELRSIAIDIYIYC